MYSRRDMQRYQNAVNNAQGHFFEGAIAAACGIYHDKERAEIGKTPEPFRVTVKSRDGTFKGRFVAHAQPDFQGTLAGGRSIVFEAKYTTTDTIRRGVLTDTQMELLESHMRRGAVAAVCVGIRDQFFFVPWRLWRDMKEHFGKVSLRAVDLAEYRVCFSGAVLFLDYMHTEFEQVFERERSVETHEGEETAQKETDRSGHAADRV